MREAQTAVHIQYSNSKSVSPYSAIYTSIFLVFSLDVQVQRAWVELTRGTVEERGLDVVVETFDTEASAN